MAEFVQTMKDWRRMCKAYTTDDESCCEGCPVVDYHKHGCGAVFEMEDSTDWQRYADMIGAWAAEHPEPVYPNWIDWLMSESVIPTNYMAANSTDSGVRAGTFYVTSKAFEPIPADIAEKLGLKPKEPTT